MNLMKVKTILVLCILGICFLIGCKQTVVIGDEKAPIVSENSGDSVTIRPNPGVSPQPSIPISNPVRVIFQIRAEFPSGSVTPDRVSMNGQVLQENTSVTPGTYNFAIEKRGYEPLSQEINVQDSDYDGIFELNVLLKTKQRIVVFDIRDVKTNAVLAPDQVTMMPLGEGTQEQKSILSDPSYVKPGRAKIVIQKQGYAPISEDILIDPDEDPYVLHYQMTPQ